MQRHFDGLFAGAAAVLWAMGSWTALPAIASAQDAGVAAGAGGTDRPDAGVTSEPVSGPGIGGDVCSCETVLEGDGIHLCTDSYEREVCDQFSCERGTESTRPCPSRGVQLCCEMPAQDTQSRLYDDCTHPNCESAFRDQCREFRGTVHDGDCDVSADPEPREDPNEICAVSAPGSDRRTPWVGWALFGLVWALRAARRSR